MEKCPERRVSSKKTPEEWERERDILVEVAGEDRSTCFPELHAEEAK